jgi:hypothetical protein
MTIFSNLYFFEQVKSRDTTKSEAEKKNIWIEQEIRMTNCNNKKYKYFFYFEPKLFNIREKRSLKEPRLVKQFILSFRK